MSRPRLLIVGASTRAAAFSAIRAGFEPVCCDMFGDIDLRSHAEWIPLSDYPEGIPNAMRDLPAMPFLFTGGLENHPGIIAALASRFEHWGSPLSAIECLREPTFPEGFRKVRSAECPPPRDGSWLMKPIRSAGGSDVAIWNRESEVAGDVYFQPLREGWEMSACCVVGKGDAVLGVAEPIGGADFRYRGNISSGSAVGSEIASVFAVCQSVGARGFVGIDVISGANNGSNKTEVLDINPRYTASIECIEWTSGRSFVAELRDEFLGPITTGLALSIQPVVAKKIIYAETLTVVPDLTHEFDVGSPTSLGWVNDIPSPGATIEKDQPICTVFAFGSTRETCLAELDARTALVSKALC